MSDRGMIETDKYPTCEVRETTIREQIQMRNSSLRQQLAEGEAALALLEKNPELEELHNALSKLNVRGLLR